MTGATATWAGPPAGDAWSPGGRLGGLLDASKPGGTLDGYLAHAGHDRRQPRHRRQHRLRRHVLHGRHGPTAATIDVVRRAAGQPASARPGSGASGTTDYALAVAQLRDGATVDQPYRAFVAQVGTDVREAIRQESNAQVLTDAVENRRQSVSGVSLDEEMSNLVRFQRAYQASARAMSTMDEMLDVLINRTGRVGL